MSRAAVNVTEAELKDAWSSSSIRSGLANVRLPSLNAGDLSRQLGEAAGRSGAVARSLKEFAVASSQLMNKNSTPWNNDDASGTFSYPLEISGNY